MRMRMLVKTPYYAHHFIKIGLLCSKYARLITVQQYVQCIESIEIRSARIANKHSQRRCCKNSDRWLLLPLHGRTAGHKQGS